MHEISLQGSEMGEVMTKDWSKLATKAYPKEGTSSWLEGATALEDSTKLRWSLSVGKKKKLGRKNPKGDSHLRWAEKGSEEKGGADI